MTVEEIRGMKTESKISIWKNGRKEYVAEVIENCGCGFDYLIRINPAYKHSIALFKKCLNLCGLYNVSVSNDFIDKCLELDYIYCNENIALIIDKII